MTYRNTIQLTIDDIMFMLNKKKTTKKKEWENI